MYSRAAEEESFAALVRAPSATDTTLSPTHSGPTSPGGEDRGEGGGGGSGGGDTHAHAHKKGEDTRVFVEKKFQLSPTLNVLGDFTPKVSTVFGWLGVCMRTNSHMDNSHTHNSHIRTPMRSHPPTHPRTHAHRNQKHQPHGPILHPLRPHRLARGLPRAPRECPRGGPLTQTHPHPPSHTNR